MAQVGSLAGSVSMLFSLCLMLLVPPVVPQEQTPVPSSRVAVSVSDPEVQKAANLAETSFNMQSSSEFYYKILQVLNAESQVAEGIKYFLTIDMVKTTCKKEKADDLDTVELKECELAPKAEEQKYSCQFEVWLNEKKTGSGIQTWRRLSWRCTTRIPYPVSE